MSLKNGFIKKFGNNFSKNISLSNYSWFNLGGNAEFLFKPNDEIGFSNYIKILVNERNKRLEFGLNGYNRFKEYFINDKFIDLFEEIYKNV